MPGLASLECIRAALKTVLADFTFLGPCHVCAALLPLKAAKKNGQSGGEGKMKYIVASKIFAMQAFVLRD